MESVVYFVFGYLGVTASLAVVAGYFWDFLLNKDKKLSEQFFELARIRDRGAKFVLYLGCIGLLCLLFYLVGHQH